MPIPRILAVASLIVSTPAATHAQEHADLVVRNARVYTMDAARSWAGALAVSRGRLAFVGQSADAAPWVGPGTRVVDAGGRLILPGFHDAHVHLALAASRWHWCDLGYPRTLAATHEAMSACLTRAAGKAWVLMRNPNVAVFPQDGPPLEFLDSVVSDRPMVIDALHSSFANSAALRVAQITSETPDPKNGRIVRDASGRPSGTLLESAQELLSAHVPSATQSELETAFRELLDSLAIHGIVSVQELSGTGRVQLYEKALAEGWLTSRIRHGQMLLGGAESPGLQEGIAAFAEAARRHSGRWLNAGAVKIFVDGDLGDRTAVLSQPYSGSDAEPTTGDPIWTQEELNGWTSGLDAAGLQMHFHAVGDRAIRMALDAVEHARSVNGPRDARHQITHLHVVAPADLPRFRGLGVVANIQPYFAENIEYNTIRALSLLGSERHAWMFRFRDLLEQGALLAVGTDAPVASPLNPFVSLQAAVTRREIGSTAPAFLPAQRLTLAEALTAYTIGAAYANFLDRESGSLEVGKWADFVMLDRNLFDVDPEEIHRARVLWTVIEGREVFSAPKLNSRPTGSGRCGSTGTTGATSKWHPQNLGRSRLCISGDVDLPS